MEKYKVPMRTSQTYMQNPITPYSPYGPYNALNPYPMPAPISPQTPVLPPINPATPLSPLIPIYPAQPTYPPMQEGPPPVTESDYIPGFLASMIGRNIKAEFVVGASQYVEKTGQLIDVGVNYFVLRDVNSRTLIMCDLYSVKFVTIIY